MSYSTCGESLGYENSVCGFMKLESSRSSRSASEKAVSTLQQLAIDNRGKTKSVQAADSSLERFVT